MSILRNADGCLLFIDGKVSNEIKFRLYVWKNDSERFRLFFAYEKLCYCVHTTPLYSAFLERYTIYLCIYACASILGDFRTIAVTVRGRIAEIYRNKNL